MPYPNGWAKLSEQSDWTPDGGWSVTQRWRGPSGVNKVDREAWLTQWLTEYYAYTALSFTEMLPMPADDAVAPGQAVCEATISFAATEDGDPQPPGENYGLIERSWTLGGADGELSIRENPRVEMLAQRWRPWPSMIRQYVTIYKLWESEALKKWDPAVGGPVGEIPQWAVPIPPAYVTGITADELDAATTLTERLLTDENPAWRKTSYTLRKTERVTSWSTLVVSHELVDRLLSWTALTALEPTLAATGLIQTGGLQPLVWLKNAPQVTVTSGGNYDLTQDYEGFIRPPAGSKRERDLTFDYDEIVETYP